MSLEELSKLSTESNEARAQTGTFYRVINDDVGGRFKAGEVGRLVEKFKDHKYDISIDFGTGYYSGLFGDRRVFSFKRVFMFRMDEVELVGEYIVNLRCKQCECDLEILPREGSGRQKELCVKCNKANRKRNQRKWDGIRRDERQSTKRKG